MAEVLRSGWLTQGPRVAEFERAFADYVGASHAVAVSSCTTALHLVMVALGIGPGDEVVCPSLSFIATANSVAHAGARPVFADVDERTFNLTPSGVARALGPRTKAILVAHQIGMPADLRRLRRRVGLSRQPSRPPPRSRGLLQLSPAQGPDHGRRRHDHDCLWRTGRAAAAPTTSRDDHFRSRAPPSDGHLCARILSRGWVQLSTHRYASGDRIGPAPSPGRDASSTPRTGQPLRACTRECSKCPPSGRSSGQGAKLPDLHGAPARLRPPGTESNDRVPARHGRADTARSDGVAPRASLGLRPSRAFACRDRADQ